MNHPDEPAAAAHVLDLVKIHTSGPATTVALDKFTASFRAGQFTAVLGPAGSGKTTLFRCMAGLTRPTSGGITVGPASLGSLDDDELTKLRRTRLGVVLAQQDLVEHLTVQQNLLLPSIIAGYTPRPGWVDAVVDAGGLRPLLGLRPADLTPAQQQHATLARALVARPGILLADEPTARLGTAEGDRLLGYLRWARARSSQSTVVFTSDLLVASHADRVLFLQDGRLEADLPNPTSISVLSRYAELTSRRRPVT